MIKIGTDTGGEMSVELQPEPTNTSKAETAGMDVMNCNRGRTVWDFLSERLTAHNTKPPYNWYRFSFYWLIFACLGYATYLVVSSFAEINKNIRQVTYGVNAIQEEASKTSHAVESLTKVPLSSGWFGRHKFDIAACKARGVEALQRANGQSINAEQSSSTYATFSGNDGFSYLSVIHCPEDGIIYLYVMGRDVKIAAAYKEAVMKEFNKIAGEPVPKTNL